MTVLLNPFTVEGGLISARGRGQGFSGSASVAAATAAVSASARGASFARASSFEQVAARYWRVFFLANNGDPAFTGLVELEMYENAYGPNVVAGGTVTASSDTTNYEIAKAVDGDLNELNGIAGSHWTTASGSHLNSWIQYDFGAGFEKAIVGIGIHGRTVEQADQNPRDFIVQYSSDGSTWTNAWSVAGSINWGHEEFRRFLNPDLTIMPHAGSPWGPHTYWRLFMVEPWTSWFNLALVGLEMRAYPGGPDQCAGGTASASNNNSAAPNAFDGNNGTYWDSGYYLGDNSHAWLKYEFPSPVEVAEFAMIGYSNYNTSPVVYALQFSDDDVTWTTAFKRSYQYPISPLEVFVNRDPKYTAWLGSVAEGRGSGRAAGVS